PQGSGRGLRRGAREPEGPLGDREEQPADPRIPRRAGRHARQQLGPRRGGARARGRGAHRRAAQGDREADLRGRGRDQDDEREEREPGPEERQGVLGGSPGVQAVRGQGVSRLTTLPSTASVATGSLPAFNFRDMGGWYLLTNDSGQYLTLEKADFERFMAGGIGPEDPLYPELESRGFVRDRLDFRSLAKSYVKKNSFQWIPGPSLHMIVVTLRCNQKCQYCHSSVVDLSRTDTDMDVETARKTVDFIFSTPNPTICIEFQGGEPLLNWPVVKFVIEYAQAKAKAQK